MLPRRPERQTDSVCFTLGDTAFHLSVVGQGKSSQTNEWGLLLDIYISLACQIFKYRGLDT